MAVWFSDLVWNLDDVSHLYSGDHLVRATRAMFDQTGRMRNEPGDLEEVKTLQRLISYIAKLAFEVEKENGTGESCDLKLAA
jgi:hypothetical protein